MTDSNRLPTPLSERFDIIGQFTNSNQASVYVVRELQSSLKYVLKLYGARHQRLAESREIDVLEIWKHLSDIGERRLVKLHEFGEVAEGQPDGTTVYRRWELQENMKLGNLRHLLEQGPWSASDCRDLVVELYESFTVLRLPSTGEQVAHRDIKPENLLVRSLPEDEQGLRLAIGDFGSARLMAGTLEYATGVAGSPAYMAPEMWDRQPRSSPAVDWWAAGLVVAEAFLGHHLADDARDELTLPAFYREQPLDLSGIDDENLRLLCSGLLHRDPAHRWGSEQVAAWLRGEEPELVADEQRTTVVTYDVAFLFLGEPMRSVIELVAAMQMRWREAHADYLPAGADYLDILVRWLRETAKDDFAADIVLSDRSPDQKLALLGTRYIPHLASFRFEESRDRALTVANLLDVAASASGGGPYAEEDSAWLHRLYESDVLRTRAGAHQAPPALGHLAHWWPLVLSACDGSGRKVEELHPIVVAALLDDRYRDDLNRRALVLASDAQALDQPWFRDLVREQPSGVLAIARDVRLVIGWRDALEETARTGRQIERRVSGIAAPLAWLRSLFGTDPAPGLPPLIMEFSVDPVPAVRGETVTISWAVRNAADVKILGLGSVETKGSAELAPQRSGQVTLRATSRSGRSRERVVDIEIDEIPQIQWLTVDPKAVVRGTPVSISWSAPGARQVEIVGVGTGPAEGSLTDVPLEPRIYEAVASNVAGLATAQTASIAVLSAPPFVTRVLELPMPQPPSLRDLTAIGLEAPVAAGVPSGSPSRPIPSGATGPRSHTVNLPSLQDVMECVLVPAPPALPAIPRNG